MGKITQEEAVVEYLKSHKIITPMDAWNVLRITKLATIISKLKRRGYIFKTVRVTTATQYTKPVAFCEYELIAEPKGD